MTTEKTRLNNVDIEAVGALVGAIEQEPTKADTVWKAEVNWSGGFASEARIRDFAPLPSDEPEGLGGGDTAPNPVEQVLGALGNCLAVGYAANATKAGIELTDLRIEIEGDIDLKTFLGLSDGHAGYDSIRVQVHLAGDADSAAIDDLHRAVVGSSPVGHTLLRPIPVAIDLAVGPGDAEGRR